MARDKERLREYQRNWLAKRKKDWLDKHGPCASCGSTADLQIDHRNPSEKVSHNVWSWSEKRRDHELAKCDVLCKRCHKLKTRRNKDKPNIVLTEEIADEIRRLHRETGEGAVKIARRLGLKYGSVDGVIRVGNWS